MSDGIQYACNECLGLLFCKCPPKHTSVRVKVDSDGVTEHVFMNGYEIPGALFECDFRTGLVTLTFRAKVEVSR